MPKQLVSPGRREVMSVVAEVLWKLSKLASSIVAGGVLIASAGPASAHHSYAMFDHNDVATVSGTIGAIQWMNPHVWVWVYVPKEHGVGYDLYGFESNTVPNISRLGWHKDSLKVGDKVSVKYFPLWHSPQRAGYFIEARRSDGSIVVGDTAASVMTEASGQPELQMIPPKDIAPPK
ncbi:MAG TPA: DUF6152 family protein [Steroidobacteraceae bacterium]|nr:DUF6152 family protein [Steroidobacteraceae bacterium]